PGGGGSMSTITIEPGRRAKSTPLPTSMSTRTVVCGAGVITITAPGANPDYLGPVYFGAETTFGSVSGSPDSQRPRGKAGRSRNTAVPAWRITWRGTALPLTKP